jgi:hypothetical protein
MTKKKTPIKWLAEYQKKKKKGEVKIPYGGTKVHTK